jgi:hypothetical protein
MRTGEDSTRRGRRYRGEPEATVAELVEKLSARNRKRPIAFWAAAVAPLDKKPREFASALKQRFYPRRSYGLTGSGNRHRRKGVSLAGS